jgi:hypothetical protein
MDWRYRTPRASHPKAAGLRKRRTMPAKEVVVQVRKPVKSMGGAGGSMPGMKH